MSALGEHTGKLQAKADSKLIDLTGTILNRESELGSIFSKDDMAEQGLNGYINELKNDARDAKDSRVTHDIGRELSMRRGEYDAAELSEIESGSQTYVKLVNEKCRSAEAWIKNLINDAGDEIFSIKPTKEPELPKELQMAAVMQAIDEESELLQMTGVQVSPEVLETRVGEINDEIEEKLKVEAERRAGAMTDKVCDQLQEGKFVEALTDGIYDFCATKCMILSGPEVRKRMGLDWKDGQVIETQKYVREFRHVPILDFYPAPETADIATANYCFERVMLSTRDVEALRGVDGIRNDVLDGVLSDYGTKGFREERTADSVKRSVTTTKSYSMVDAPGVIEGWIFYGTVQGSMLHDWGVPIEKQIRNYPFKVCAMILANRVVRVQSWEGRIPYFKASYDEGSPDDFYGEGIAGILSDIQDRANILGRAINNNIELCGGPQIIIQDSDRLDETEINTIKPFDVWQFKSQDPIASRSGQAKPIEFYQPNFIAQHLQGMLEQTQQRAEATVGIPSYPLASFEGAAKGTASGMSMVLNAASKGMLAAISNIDNGIIRPVVEMMNRMNLKESDDDVIKGDLKCVAKGLRARLDSEQTLVRGQELLANTLNPIDNYILGIRGRAAILKKQAERVGIDISDLIPDDEIGLAMQFQKNMMMLQGGMAGSPGADAAPTEADGSTVGGDDYQVSKGVGAGARNMARAEGR